MQYKINPKKAPGYDLITGKNLKERSRKGLSAITQIYNALPQNEYRVIHKSLRDFRPLRYSSRDDHA